VPAGGRGGLAAGKTTGITAFKIIDFMLTCRNFGRAIL
jgi:hypothetical protein